MADVFVLDSYYEGWSISATEALYDGLPIIHSMCGSAVELTNGGKYGMIVPNPAGNLTDINTTKIAQVIERGEYRNTKEVVMAIRIMLENRVYWEHERINIAKESQVIFSVEKMVDKYFKMLTLN